MKKKKISPSKYAIGIVAAIAALGILFLFFNSGLGSEDISGQAIAKSMTTTSKTKISATTISTTSTSTRCTDSDGGKDTEELGTVKGILFTDQDGGVNEYTDNCKDTTSLKEYRCVAEDGTNDGTKYAYFNTVTCDDGYCLDGVCVSCYDTDDSNSNIVGTVTFGGTTYTDTCCTDGVDCAGYTDSGRVKEYTCNGNSLSVSYPSCTRGTTCVDGACV